MYLQDRYAPQSGVHKSSDDPMGRRRTHGVLVQFENGVSEIPINPRLFSPTDWGRIQDALAAGPPLHLVACAQQPTSLPLPSYSMAIHC